jgi:hypothetical protein
MSKQPQKVQSIQSEFSGVLRQIQESREKIVYILTTSCQYVNMDVTGRNPITNGAES